MKDEKETIPKAEVHPLFPHPVYFSKLGRELTKNETRTVNKFKDETLALRSTSSFESIAQKASKDHYVLEKKGLENLKEDLNIIILDYFDKIICTSNSVTPYITQSWFNYTESNQFLQRHAHQNSFLSGVYYVAADKEVDKIEFFKAGYDTIMLEYEKYNLFNSTSWNIPIETGNVILFPSHLVHGVDNKKGPNLRISLAFNVFLMGHIGSDEKIMQLKLK